jgi:hypothetical protein
MSDGKVEYKFTGDAQSMLREMAKMEKKYEDLENKIKQVSRTSKRAKQDEESANAAAVGALHSLVGTYATAAGAVSLLTQAYSEWRKEIENAAEAEDKFGRKLVADLALAGDLARGPQIQQFLQNMPGVPQNVASTSFFGVRGGAPGLDFGRAQEVATQVAGTQGFIFKDNLDKLKDFGELAGKLAELAPEKSSQDITDLAAAVNQAAGRNVGSLTSQGAIKAIGKMVEGGKPIEEALATVVRALDVGLRPQGLDKTKAEDMALIGDAQVKALRETFGQAQTSDLSLKNLRAAAQLGPDDFLEFTSGAQIERNVRGLGQRAEARGARQQQEISEASNGFTRLGARFGAFVENTLTPLRELKREREGNTQELAIPAVESAATQKLDEMVGLLKKIADQGAQNRPPIRRDAQNE